MQSFARITASALIALAMCFGAFALVGCGGSSSQGGASASAESSASASEAASTAADEGSDQSASDASDEDDEQDNCYGDDLPAKKS